MLSVDYHPTGYLTGHHQPKRGTRVAQDLLQKGFPLTVIFVSTM